MEFCKEMLSNDHSGIGLKSLKEELFEMNCAIKSYMDKGLTKEDLEIAQELKKAVEASEQAIEIVHKKYNG